MIDIPKDVSAEKTTFTYPAEIQIRGYKPIEHPNKQQVEKKLLEAIEEAERPVILAGAGVVHSGAHHELFGIC
ncbi:hypothetical protein GCM10020331_037390 [Ectobacillus funiculus]